MFNPVTEAEEAVQGLDIINLLPISHPCLIFFSLIFL
jgi:hypothetical protein